MRLRPAGGVNAIPFGNDNGNSKDEALRHSRGASLRFLLRSRWDDGARGFLVWLTTDCVIGCVRWSARVR